MNIELPGRGKEGNETSVFDETTVRLKGFPHSLVPEADTASPGIGKLDFADTPWFSRAWRGLLIAAACCLAVGLAWFYFIGRSVEGFEISGDPIVVEIAGPGILDAINKVTITSRLTGFVRDLLVDRNDRVSRDQILAKLDARDIENQLESAKADLEAARNSVRESQSNAAKNQLILQRAANELSRKQTLIKTGVATAVDVENLEIALAQAEADLERTAAAHDRASAQVKSSEYQVEVLNVKRQEADIRSPIEGVVVSRDRNKGDLVTIGASLLQVVDPGSIVVSARFDESILGGVLKDQRTSIQFTSDPLRKISGKVLRVNRTVDAETREFMVDVVPDELPTNWAIGQRANVVISVPLPKGTIAIPLRYIIRKNGKSGVWKSVANRAVWTEVNLGTVSGSYVHVVNGLELGSLILHPDGRYNFEPVSVRVAKP